MDANVGGDLGEFEPGVLQGGQGSAERVAFLHVLDGLRQGALRGGHGADRQRQPLPLQLVHQYREAPVHLAKNVLSSLDEVNDIVDTFKAGMELKSEMIAVVKQAYPSTISFFNDLSSDFHIDEMTILLRKVITNLDTLGEAMDLLKMGVEFRDEMVPVVQLM